MLDASYLDAIKQFEGYTAEARWDYAQHTNGYGTRARFAGEVIDKTEADRRFAEAIKTAADFVEKFAPGLDEGSKAALTSLTYNAGTAWAQSGLGQAVASGDMEKARSLFLQYNKAGGSVLDGLAQRRLREVTWFGEGISNRGSATTGTAEEAVATAADGLLPERPRAITDDMIDRSAPLFTRDLSTDGKSMPMTFTGLGGDPALLALLTHLAKTHLSRGDEATRKPDDRPQTA